MGWIVLSGVRAKEDFSCLWAAESIPARPPYWSTPCVKWWWHRCKTAIATSRTMSAALLAILDTFRMTRASCATDSSSLVTWAAQTRRRRHVNGPLNYPSRLEGSQSIHSSFCMWRNLKFVIFQLSFDVGDWRGRVCRSQHFHGGDGTGAQVPRWRRQPARKSGLAKRPSSHANGVELLVGPADVVGSRPIRWIVGTRLGQCWRIASRLPDQIRLLQCRRQSYRWHFKIGLERISSLRQERVRPHFVG